MARSPDAVKADIALTRRVIESDLDALHRLVPRRSWLVYAWVAGGVAAGLLLSRAPLVMVIGRGLRIVRVGAALIGMAEILERMLPGPGSKREGTLPRATPWLSRQVAARFAPRRAPGLLPKRERMLPGPGAKSGGRPHARRTPGRPAEDGLAVDARLSSTRQRTCAEQHTATNVRRAAHGDQRCAEQHTTTDSAPSSGLRPMRAEEENDE